jgi:hypothetical protein
VRKDGADAGRIALVKDQEIHDLLCRDRTVFLGVGLFAGRTEQGRTPFVAVAFDRTWHEGDAVPHFEQARHVFGPLHVAGHPEQG